MTDDSRVAIGLDLGGTKIAGGLVTHDGHLLAADAVNTPAADGPAAIIAAAAALVGSLRADNTVEAIGIGAAGVVDPAARRILAATSSLAGWAGTEVGADLEAATGLPVACDNDVRAHAVGEAWRGAGRGSSSMLLVAAGTGIGGAFVASGRPLIGAHAASGHFGHIPSAEAAGLPCPCGGSGHLEAIASGPAVVDTYHRNGGTLEAKTARDVVRLADRPASAAVTTSAEALGRATAGLVNSLDPAIVVVTGGLAGAGDCWWQPLRRSYSSELMGVVQDCRLVSGELGGDAAVIGAAKLAFESLDSPESRPRKARP